MEKERGLIVLFGGWFDYLYGDGEWVWCMCVCVCVTRLVVISFCSGHRGVLVFCWQIIQDTLL